MLIRHLMCAALSTAFFCSTLAAQAPCGLNSVLGRWSYSAVGWTVPLQPANATPVPYVMIGVLVVDYGGTISGPGTGIMGGVVMEFELDGKIEVNSSCTAIMTYGMTVPTTGGPYRIPGDAVARLVISPRAEEIVGHTQVVPPAWGMKANWLTTMKLMSPVPAAVTWPAIPAPAGSQ